jgi:hypothetical protein
MRVATYNILKGGSQRVHWVRMIEDFGVDLLLVQESYPHHEHLPPNLFPDAGSRCAWGMAGKNGWGSGVFSRTGSVMPVAVPNFSGWVVGAEISGASWQVRMADPLLAFSVHAPSKGEAYWKQVNKLLDEIKKVAAGRQCETPLRKSEMPSKTISINRAPVLTLWASVVAERLGFDQDEGLSLAKALAGLTALSKGRRLGIYKPHEQGAKEAREKEHGEEFWIELCGRPLPARNTEKGIRAVKGAQVIEPGGVRRYLESKFGDDLGRVQSAMQRLARTFEPKELADIAFRLYERFRPAIPEGVRGWGAKGNLDLGVIEGLAR